MSVATSLSVPVVLWGKTAPTHCISCILLSRDQRTLATGCYDGQICLWQVDPDTLKMTPRCLLVGHTGPVLCLSKASIMSDNNFIVSSSETGEMCTWDLVDGKCCEVVKLPYVHTNIQAYHLSGQDDVRLFCNGYYAEVLVMDPFSLEIVFTLKDVVLALTTTGTVKVWTLTGQENKASEPLFENESKQIRCLNALSMTCCAYNQRTVLVLCSKFWQIYDAGDFSVLCSVISPRGERWLGGDFLATDRVIVWSDEGKGYLYKLPAKGDSEGQVLAWAVPDVSSSQLAQLRQEEFARPPGMPPMVTTSLTKAWADMKPPPVGILDQLDSGDLPGVKLTASIYLSQQNRLVVGREDGSIIIVPATQTVLLQLLHGRHQQYDDWPPHQLLPGHAGRVNCLLYPHHHHPRYERSHLVSGGVDFAVCLWDLYAGTLLHKFCVHAGEITQLLVPPPNCTPRIQTCVCSVASDHSVTLLSLTQRRCYVLASRHLFPVVSIKWRPLDDFMVVGCSDGTVYVWQMETGHLDRVLHGIGAEEVLFACDETAAAGASGGGAAAGEVGLANPAVHFFRGLRHRNLSAIRHATQRGLHQLQQLHQGAHQDPGDVPRPRGLPLDVQGLRTNPRDPEAHVLCFDIEALIDFFGRVKDKAGDVERILKEKDRHGILAKMKEGAENVQTKLQAKAESVGFRPVNMDGRDAAGSPGGSGGSGARSGIGGTAGRWNSVSAESAMASPSMEVAQLLLSLLHAWGMDPDLDRVCETKLGLLRPMLPVSFGVVSKGGYMSLLLPTWLPQALTGETVTTETAPATLATGGTPGGLEKDLPPELVRMERSTRLFTARAHWELSTTLTSTHLLAVVALANTLMAMSNASFVPEQERSRKQATRSSLGWASKAEQDSEELWTAQQAQIKQGWSLLATLHCVLLPDKVAAAGSRTFKRPQVEMLARRWQHHCLEVREAAQALLLAELGRLGPRGRKALVDAWAPYVPAYGTAPGDTHAPQTAGTTASQANSTGAKAWARKPWSTAELRRKQTTAVVLLGVIGAEFGQDAAAEASAAPVHLPTREQQRRKSSVVEGFGLGHNSLARRTSLALTHLLLAEPSPQLPAHTQLRRAAIDLLGRGFTVWEPHLDVTKVLLGLLELCCHADKLVPSMTYGLPLSPAADSCRTARHALTLIATARPAAFITTMAREVARYNTLQQNSQALNVNLHSSVLHRAKPEILRGVELLIDKMQSEMSDLLIEVVDIVLHCVDPGHLKQQRLNEVFPAVCRFQQVSHCPHTRRIAVGARSGQVALYELRSNRCQTVSAHSSSVTACAFSPDGKFLATYSCQENRLSFWQTSTGMFGLGNSQTRCVKSYSTAPIPDMSRLNPARLARLVWINNRTVALMLADGSETRFNV
ncbi:uncharacterized protein GBIM_13199 [Gryllus bimaculatus]|nr:uncharacterized protein GBIM_13199 [Gryllus bimaculatus]